MIIDQCLEKVKLIESKMTGQELKLQIRGYLVAPPPKPERIAAEHQGKLDAKSAGTDVDRTVTSIASDIFHTLRGKNNLVIGDVHSISLRDADKIRVELWPLQTAAAIGQPITPLFA